MKSKDDLFRTLFDIYGLEKIDELKKNKNPKYDVNGTR